MSRILGHKAIAGTIAVSGIYDRIDRLPEIRAALTAWSVYVETLLADEEKRGELVAFDRAATPSRDDRVRGRLAASHDIGGGVSLPHGAQGGDDQDSARARGRSSAQARPS